MEQFDLMSADPSPRLWNQSKHKTTIPDHQFPPPVRSLGMPVCLDSKSKMFTKKIWDVKKLNETQAVNSELIRIKWQGTKTN